MKKLNDIYENIILNIGAFMMITYLGIIMLFIFIGFGIASVYSFLINFSRRLYGRIQNGKFPN